MLRCPTATIVCLGSGPSLTPEDIAACRRASCLFLAVNDTYQLVPDAMALFAGDRKWWGWHLDALKHAGLKYMFGPCSDHRLGAVTKLHCTGPQGLESDPTGLRHGGHSGYAAINLAAHFSPKRILLLGYDLQPAANGDSHYFGEHPDASHPRWTMWRDRYATLLDPLRALGIALVNCSRATAITAVPRLSLEVALG